MNCFFTPISMCSKTIVAICIPIAGILVTIFIALARYIIRRMENSKRTFWEYQSYVYQPQTKQYPEELTLIISNISSDVLTVEKIIYGCCKCYKYPNSLVCKPNEDLRIELIPTIPNFLSRKCVYVLYRDGMGYKHKFKITSEFIKSDKNVKLNIHQ